MCGTLGSIPSTKSKNCMPMLLLTRSLKQKEHLRPVVWYRLSNIARPCLKNKSGSSTLAGERPAVRAYYCSCRVPNSVLGTHVGQLTTSRNSSSRSVDLMPLASVGTDTHVHTSSHRHTYLEINPLVLGHLGLHKETVLGGKPPKEGKPP